MSSADRIDEQAAEWLIRLDQPKVSTRMREAFAKWCTDDPRHEVAYVRLSVSWERSNRLKAMRPIDTTADPDLLSPTASECVDPPRRFPRGFTKQSAAIAAALIVAVGVGAVSLVWHHDSAWRYYSVQAADIRRIVLQDGSVIFLNADSRVRVRYTNLQRVVQLLKGEANFRVAHDTARPFDVEVGDAVVRAVGTQFTVRRWGETELDVVVNEGQVLIDSPTLVESSESLRAASGSTPPAKNVLRAGDVASLSKRALTVRAADQKTLREENRWMDGRLWFERMTLRDVVAMFNARNPRRIEIVDERIADLRIGGGFADDDPASFLAAAARTLPVRIDDSDPSRWLIYSAER